MVFVACTTFVASTLADVGFVAELVVLDQAGQASQSDVHFALFRQNQVKLLIMGGDYQQLGPVLLSNMSKRNTYGNVASLSMMVRLIIGYPHIARTKLVISYRGHPRVIHMTSQLFYDGELKPAPERKDS